MGALQWPPVPSGMSLRPLSTALRPPVALRCYLVPPLSLQVPPSLLQRPPEALSALERALVVSQ